RRWRADRCRIRNPRVSAGDCARPARLTPSFPGTTRRSIAFALRYASMERGARRTELYWYAIAIVAVAAASLVTVGLQRWMGTSISLFFFPAIIVIASYGGYGPAMLATVLST